MKQFLRGETVVGRLSCGLYDSPHHPSGVVGRLYDSPTPPAPYGFILDSLLHIFPFGHTAWRLLCSLHLPTQYRRVLVVL